MQEDDEDQKRAHKRNMIQMIAKDTVKGRKEHQILQIQREKAKAAKKELISKKVAAIKLRDSQSSSKQLNNQPEEKAVLDNRLRFKKPKL